jgi:hypothetical protein
MSMVKYHFTPSSPYGRELELTLSDHTAQDVVDELLRQLSDPVHKTSNTCKIGFQYAKPVDGKGYDLRTFAGKDEPAITAEVSKPNNGPTICITVEDTNSLTEEYNLLKFAVDCISGKVPGNVKMVIQAEDVKPITREQINRSPDLLKWLRDFIRQRDYT